MYDILAKFDSIKDDSTNLNEGRSTGDAMLDRDLAARDRKMSRERNARDVMRPETPAADRSKIPAALRKARGDAPLSKDELKEGSMKRWLEDLATSFSKAEFVADAAEYGMSPEEAAEFWINVNGGDEELDEAWPGTPEYELKFGKPEASSAFDKKKISTGTVYSRKHQEEPEAADDDEPKKKGRPAGSKRSLGAKLPSGKQSKLHKQGAIKEEDDDAPVDYITEKDWEKIVRLKNKLMSANDMEPEDAEQEAAERLGYDYEDVLDYINNLEENTGDYSAKKARAGKDIGKPGKNFAKIARGAAERYGSKERGERVAGAVLNKLRHPKESVEESDMEEGFRQGMLGEPPLVKMRSKNGAASQMQAWNDLIELIGGIKAQNLIDPYLLKHLQKLAQQLKPAEGVEEVAPPGAKAERMVKHIKKSLSKDGHLSDKDKAIAYATTWKAHNKGKVEEEGKPDFLDLDKDGDKKEPMKKAAKEKSTEKKEVEETTVAGSVATAPAEAPKKGKGGVQYGKGVYESQIAESFEARLNSILNEGMTMNINVDQEGHKNVTVSATDDDADALSDMLKMAGMFSSGGYKNVCPECGESECGCDHIEEADLANSPNEEYADTETMTQTLSGGLNGPKTTGQTTIPVLNKDSARQGVAAKVEEAKQQAESRLWNLYKKYDK